MLHTSNKPWSLFADILRQERIARTRPIFPSLVTKSPFSLKKDPADALDGKHPMPPTALSLLGHYNNAHCRLRRTAFQTYPVLTPFYLCLHYRLTTFCANRGLTARPCAFQVQSLPGCPTKTWTRMGWPYFHSLPSTSVCSWIHRLVTEGKRFRKSFRLAFGGCDTSLLGQ